MRAGVSAVQWQTLTSEAAAVLKLAVAEAQRRGHAQVTPLHVATTLLASSSSVLRHACVQSHHHLPQPPHCRNLELCFKVALDRLQTSSSGGNSAGITSPSLQSNLQHNPGLSNALVAALKRAQAHQRRGYPEQQQVPLLAVKVEMEQLIISILDDPSVSRVMREASFSSTQVKNSLEEALASSSGSGSGSSCAAAAQARRMILPSSPAIVSSNPGVAIASSPDRLRLKLGSTLEQYGSIRSNSGSGGSSSTSNSLLLGMIPLVPAIGGNTSSGKYSADVARVQEILQLRSRKRNPLLFGEQPPHGLAEEVMQRLSSSSTSEMMNPMIHSGALRNLRIVSPQFASIALGLHAREEVEAKLADIARLVEKSLLCSPGVVLYLGDLQWLVERPSPAASISPPEMPAYCPVEHAVREIGKLVSSSSPESSSSNRLWLLGVASSQTYMRCQARHPSLDNLWGLQPLPISTGFNLTLRNTSGAISNGIPQASAPRFGGLESNSSPARSLPGRSAWPMLPPFKQQQPDDRISDKFCADCSVKYEQELGELQKQQQPPNQRNASLPFWLKPAKDPEGSSVKKLQMKWTQTCKSLHGATNGVTKVASGVTNTSASSIPWLSLHPTPARAPAPAPAPATPAPTSALKKRSDETHPALVQIPSRRTSSGESCEVLSTDIGLSLKTAVVSPPVIVVSSGGGGSLPSQKPTPELIHTELVLGRSSTGSSNGSCLTSSDASPNPKRSLNNLNNLELLEKSLGPLSKCPPAGGAAAEKRFPERPPIAVTTTPMIVSKAPPSTPSPSPSPSPVSLPSPAPASAPAPAGVKDLDFKSLCKALSESVPWQKDALDSIASAVLNCRSGGEKRRGSNVKYDSWLLLLGSDALAKRRVAKVLAEQVFGTDRNLFRLSLRSVESTAAPGRGRTPLDKLAEAVRLKPFSVILLEDIDEADFRLKSALMRAIDRGRLADSSGREVSIANLIVVMTSSVGEELFAQQEMVELNEEVSGMKLLVEEAAAPELVRFKSGRVSVVSSGEEEVRSRKSPLKANLDLNMPLEEEPGHGVLFEEVDDETRVVSEEEQVKLVLERAEEQISKQFFSKMSRTVVFRPFNFNKLAELVVSEINSAVLATKLSIEVESSLLKHLVAILWEGKHEEFQKWVIQVLDTSAMEKLRSSSQQQQSVIKLVADRSSSSSDVLRLPKRIRTSAGDRET